MAISTEVGIRGTSMTTQTAQADSTNAEIPNDETTNDEIPNDETGYADIGRRCRPMPCAAADARQIRPGVRRSESSDRGLRG